MSSSIDVLESPIPGSRAFWGVGVAVATRMSESSAVGRATDIKCIVLAEQVFEVRSAIYFS